jgi:hypothetical protein
VGSNSATLFAQSANLTLTWNAKYIQIPFKTANSTNGDWVAIKVNAAISGVSGMSLLGRNHKNGANADLYFLQVPEDADTLSDDEKKAYIEAGLTAQNYVCQFQTPKSGTYVNHLGTFNTGKSTEFILVFKCSAGQSGNIYTSCSTLYQTRHTQVSTPDELTTAMTTLAGSNANCEYAVTLSEDITIDGLTVPANVTLNLHGKTLTATNLTLNGKLMDAQDGTGLLKMAPSTGITAASGGMLLYDNRDDYKGYRVYSGYSIEAYRGKLQSLDDGSKKLWIKLNFTNTDAYNVIATGNSLIEVGVNMSWVPSGGTAEEISMTFDHPLVAEWGGKMADPEREGDYGLYVQFTGFEALPTGRLNLTPTVKGANTTTVVSAATIAYNHIVE